MNISFECKEYRIKSDKDKEKLVKFRPKFESKRERERERAYLS